MNLKIEYLSLAFLSLFLIIFAIYHNFNHTYSQHYGIAAYSLINGHLDLIAGREKFLDTVLLNGKYYFTADPGTTILMLPISAVFILLGFGIAPQSILNMPLLLFISIFLYKICTTLQVKRFTSKFWLVLAFIFGTSIISVIYIPNTWNIAQTASVTLTLAFLAEWLNRKRLIILLPLIVFLVLTRKQILVPVLGYLFAEALTNKQFPKSIYELLKSKVIIISLVGIIAYLLYVELLYKRVFIPNLGSDPHGVSFMPEVHRQVIENIGLYNIKYVPKNLYYYFVNSPDPIHYSDLPASGLMFPYLTPSSFGTSLFLISPILFSIFFSKFSKIYLPSLLGGISLLLVYLSFFSSGQDQFGLRYSADLIPFFFLPVINIYKDFLPISTKILIIISILFNCYLLVAFFLSGKTL